MLKKGSVSDLQDRLRYLEDRLKNLDKFDSPPGRQGAQGSPSKPVRAGVKKDAGQEVPRAAGGMAKKDTHTAGAAPAMAYGREARSRNAARTNPADFLGEDFMKRLVSVQQESKLTGSKASDDSLKKGKRQSLEGADGGMAELNSLYAVVQDIKKDLGQMSTPGSMRAPASKNTPASTRTEPDRPAPELHKPKSLQRIALPEPDGGAVGVAEPKAPLRKGPVSPQLAAKSQSSAQLETLSNLTSGMQESSSISSVRGAEGRQKKIDVEGLSSTRNRGAAEESDPPVLPSKAPSVTVPKLNLSTLMPAPTVILPNVSPQLHNDHSADFSADDGVDPAQVAMRLDSPSAGDSSSDGGDLRDHACQPRHILDGMGAHVLQANGSDWEAQERQQDKLSQREEEQNVQIQTKSIKAQRSAGPLLPAPPDADDLQRFGNDWESSSLEAMIPGLEADQDPARKSVEQQELVSNGGDDVPVVVFNKTPAFKTSTAPPPDIRADKNSFGGPHSGSEEAQETVTSPLSGSGPTDTVAVKMTLDEDYNQLLSTPAKRLQMERMIKEDVADSLRVPRTRIHVVKLEQGSIEAYINILPSERKNGGPTPDELADMLISQVSDTSSKLRRQMSTRRASRIVKCPPLEPSNTGAPPTPLPTSAFTTPLKRVPEDADASADGPTSLVREAEKGEAVDDSSCGGTPLTEGKSISDRMAMFREMERRSGSVPKPQTQINRGPHFSAPKAALQAHVQREKTKLQGDVSRDELEETRAALRAPGSGWKSGTNANESSLPLLSPPTNLDFTSAASIDRSRSGSGSAAVKGATSADAAPQKREQATDLLFSMQDSPRASPENTFGVVLSSPNMRAIGTPEHTPGGDLQSIPDMPRAVSSGANDGESDALTPFGVRLKKVPRKYEDIPAQSPRRADGEPAPVANDSAQARLSSPSAEPSSPLFTIPNFDEGPGDIEEPAPQPIEEAIPDIAPVAPSSERELDEDIFAQFGLTSAPSSHVPASTLTSTAPEPHGSPGLQEPVLNPSQYSDEAASRTRDVPSASEQQPLRLSGTESAAKSFKAPPPPQSFAAPPPPSMAEMASALAPAEQDEQPDFEHVAREFGSAEDTPQKSAEDSLAGLFSPLVATADDMMQNCAPQFEPQIGEDAEPAHVQAAPPPLPYEAQPDVSDVDLGTLDRGSGKMPSVGSDTELQAIATEVGVSVEEPRIEGEGKAEIQAVKNDPAAVGTLAHDGVAPGSETLGADGESVGLQMVLDDDFDRAMAQWQQTASSMTGCAPTLENAKTAFSQQLAHDLHALLKVPLERVRVLGLQPGSIVASVNLDKGPGPSPIELANLLIYQVTTLGSAHFGELDLDFFLVVCTFIMP